MNEPRQNPWAGLASYQDPAEVQAEGHEPLLFCGRDDESFDVAQLIDDNIFVTLYGKSGTGKTSLLNAGVFPRLRKKQYLPISIRLGMEAISITFQECITKKLQKAFEGYGTISTIDVVSLPEDVQSMEYLWNLFARTRFADNEGRTLFPVLVFDQFEEVFRHRRKDADALLRQIHFMMDESHALGDRVIDGQLYSYDFNFRFVASIREDDLYRLEDSIDNNYLIGMKRCRYRLRNLSETGACDAIFTPGEGLLRDDERDRIANTIIGIARNHEDDSISANILSLICSRIFVEYQRSGAQDISLSLVDQFVKGNPFEQFYNEATRGLSNREKSYIETHLIDSTGRRNSIPESDFLLHVKNGTALFDGDRKILQRLSTSSDGGNYRVELIHDSFCLPLANLKEKHERRKKLKRIIISFTGIILLLGVLVSILSLYQRNRIQKGTIKITRDELVIKDLEIKRMDNEIKRMDNEIKLKDSEIQRKEDELTSTQGKIDSINKEYYELDLALAKYKTTKKEAKLDITFFDDGIKYSRYGFFDPNDLPDWKSQNEDLCRKKIPQLLKNNKYFISEKMIEKEPGLVYLILKSESLKNTEDKQEWFTLWDLMNEVQINKLYDILARERYKQAILRSQGEAEWLNNEAYKYAEKGNYDEAMTTIDKAIKLSRVEYANKFDSKGEILLMRGNTKEAKEMWDKVMDIAPDFLNYHSGSKLYKKLQELNLVNE